MIELNAFGLIEYWMKFHAANPYQCLDSSTHRNNKQTSRPRLSLKNLTGAFAVLVFGYTISLIIFILERFKFYYQHSRNESIDG